MSRVKCWQVDAFTDRPFGGNPAAICWLEQAADDGWMQSVAAEMNLAETAFVSRREDGYGLRWFSPLVEVDLCGHATLATAHALWTSGYGDRSAPLRFHTKSGLLTCSRNGELIELDFPALPAVATPPYPGLLEALEVATPLFVGKTKYDMIVQLSSPEEVRTLRPNFRKLGEIPTRGIIVTAHADQAPYDFISRFFAPAVGVDEDPVCGSAHCCLTPFWAERLGKTTLRAYQASTRGGDLHLQARGDRVTLAGQAAMIWEGELLT